MGISGSLKTLSLPNLIQLQCQQLQATQVNVTRGKRSGVLAFANGDLIFAAVENMTGDEAVKEMLSWEDGDFQVIDQVTTMLGRNVTTPWSMLLLNALHQIDEARAERNTAIETVLKASQNSKEIFNGVMIEGDKLLAAAADAPEQDAAFIAFIVGRAQAVAQAMRLGTVERLVATRPSEKLCIERVGAAYLGCRIGERATLDALKSKIEPLI